MLEIISEYLGDEAILSELSLLMLALKRIIHLTWYNLIYSAAENKNLKFLFMAVLTAHLLVVLLWTGLI